MITEADLVELIEHHLSQTGETASAFGRRIANDTGLVADLRVGRSPGLKLVRRILEAIKEEERAAGLD